MSKIKFIYDGRGTVVEVPELYVLIHKLWNSSYMDFVPEDGEFDEGEDPKEKIDNLLNKEYMELFIKHSGVDPKEVEGMEPQQLILRPIDIKAGIEVVFRIDTFENFVNSTISRLNYEQDDTDIS